MARVRIEIDLELCDGCGVCVPACSQTAFGLEGGKARLGEGRGCEGLERCLGRCPRGALRWVGTGTEEPGAAGRPGGQGLPPGTQAR